MKPRRLWTVIGLLLTMLVALSACSQLQPSGEPTSDEQTIEEKVAATLQAMASEQAVQTAVAQTVTAASEPAAGTITGALSYPSEFLPPQRVIAFDSQNLNQYYAVEVSDESAYSLEVPPGTYFVLAYLLNPQEIGAMPGWGAAYSRFVLCGLQAGCTDHSLVPVTVTAGETISDIDPSDWYLPPEEDAGWPTDPNIPETGAISGKLGYPSEYIPPLRVVAFDRFGNDYYYVDTQLNQSSYTLEGLPPGVYQVVAFVQEPGNDLKGGYSEFVPCGMDVSCTDHRLIEVFVYAGQTVSGVDPIDYYMQPGEAVWPDDPTR